MSERIKSLKELTQSLNHILFLEPRDVIDYGSYRSEGNGTLKHVLSMTDGSYKIIDRNMETCVVTKTLDERYIVWGNAFSWINFEKALKKLGEKTTKQLFRAFWGPRDSVDIYQYLKIGWPFKINIPPESVSGVFFICANYVSPNYIAAMKLLEQSKVRRLEIKCWHYNDVTKMILTKGLVHPEQLQTTRLQTAPSPYWRLEVDSLFVIACAIRRGSISIPRSVFSAIIVPLVQWSLPHILPDLGEFYMPEKVVIDDDEDREDETFLDIKCEDAGSLGVVYQRSILMYYVLKSETGMCKFISNDLTRCIKMNDDTDVTWDFSPYKLTYETAASAAKYLGDATARQLLMSYCRTNGKFSTKKYITTGCLFDIEMTPAVAKQFVLEIALVTRHYTTDAFDRRCLTVAVETIKKFDIKDFPSGSKICCSPVTYFLAMKGIVKVPDLLRADYRALFEKYWSVYLDFGASISDEKLFELALE